MKLAPAPGNVQVAVERSRDRACLRVCDTGIGFAAELLPKIFAPYCQENRGRFGGLGLGLPIAKGLVDLHGGEIAAFSAGPGTGCTITVHLPLVDSAARQSASVPDAAPPTAQRRLSR
jgi:signal transduction histidine kinase